MPVSGWIFVTSATASALGTWLVMRHAQRLGLIANPNQRSSHANPTPTSGGLAVFITFVLAAAILLWFATPTTGVSGLVTMSILVALIGLIDDTRDLAIGKRLTAHILSATVAALAMLIEVERGGNLAALWMAPAIALCLVAALNFFNFMDGIDGLAGSEAVFFALAGAWFLAQQGQWDLVYLLLATGGACLGFLVFNWPPARIFMGDVGSGLLGFMLASVALLASLRGELPIAVWAVLGGAFLMDASITLLRRMVSGEKWWTAHRSHAYQALADLTGSHLRATLIYTAVNVLWLLPAAIFLLKMPSYKWVIMTMALLPLGVAVYLVQNGRARVVN